MRLAHFMIIAAFIAVVGLLLLYVMYFSRADFSSDDAVLNMLAESIAEQGTLFPKGWVSNNGDLMIPSGALILAPLLSWFSSSFALHAVAGVFAVALMLLSFFGFLKSIHVPTSINLLATAVLATGLSKLFVMMLYLQTTYVWLSAGVFVSAMIVWRRRSANDEGRTPGWTSLCALAMIVFFLAFANPRRALVMFLIPIYVFDRVLAFQSTPSIHWLRRIARALGLNDAPVWIGMALPFLLAEILYNLSFHLGVVETVHFASKLRWEGFASLRTHADVFFRSWIPVLGGGREAMEFNASLDSFLRLFRYLFALWLTWVGLAEVIRLRRNQSRLRTALALTWLAALIPTLFIFIVYAPLAIDAATMRYFTIPILWLLAMAALRVASASGWWTKSAPVVAILMSLLLIAVASVRFVPAMTSPGMRLLQARESPPMRLAQLLMDENLHWGYATWWNAGVTTVLTESKVRVSPVFNSDSGLAPFTCMIQREWYQTEAWSGETFLALSQNEATPEMFSSLEMNLGPESRLIRSPEFTVLVYEWNIATNFSCDLTSVTATPGGSDQPRGEILAAKSGSDGPLKPGEVVGVLIRNHGAGPLAGRGEAPIALRFDWITGAKNDLTALPGEILLPCAIGPGETRAMQIKLPESPENAIKLRISLSQKVAGGAREVGGAGFEVPFNAKPLSTIFHEGFDQRHGNK